VEQDEEVPVELFRAVYIVLDIGFVELYAVHKPFDRGSVPFNGIHMVAGHVYRGAGAVLRMVAIRAGPVDGAYGIGFRVYMLHDVYLAARRPANGADVIAQHPEGRPGAGECGYGYTGFYFAIPPRFPALGFHPGGGVVKAAKAFALGG